MLRRAAHQRGVDLVEPSGGISYPDFLRQLYRNVLNLELEFLRESDPKSGYRGLITLAENTFTFLANRTRDTAGSPVRGRRREDVAELRALFDRQVLRPLMAVENRRGATPERVIDDSRIATIRFKRSITDRMKRAKIAPPPLTDNEDGESSRVILVYDLARFSARVLSMASLVEKGEIMEQVRLVVKRIKNLAREAVEKTSVKLIEDATIALTGDGAVLHFDSVIDALVFASELHRITDDRNGVDHPIEDRVKNYFRIGICFGDIYFEPKRNAPLPRTDTMGLAFITATRLTTACRTGQILVSKYAWTKLEEELQRAGSNPDMRRLTDGFKFESGIPGKKHEKTMTGYRKQAGSKADWDVDEPAI